jgi:hypothetical protein
MACSWMTSSTPIRKPSFTTAYKKAQRIAKEVVDDGRLREYVTRLVPLQLFDVDPFH